MIITFPTALYLSVLEEAGNITFLVSSTDPPRPQTTTLQLFRGEELRELPQRVFTEKDREKTLGQLFASLAFGSKAVAGQGKKPLEIGQLLEFITQQEQVLPEALAGPEQLDIQHDLNLLDLEAAGLNDEEIDELQETAQTRFKELVGEFKAFQTTIASTKIKIDSNQRTTNEVRKAIQASQIAFSADSSDGNEIIRKLEDKQQQLEAERLELIRTLDDTVRQSNATFDQLIALREVVR
jgi:hypothetical protein